MYILKELVEKTIESGASDLHLSVGIPPTVRVNGRLQHIGTEILNDAMVEELAKEILKNRYDEYRKMGEYDLAYQEEGIGRFRVNVFRQKGHDAVALRVIPLKVPTLDDLKHPRIFKDLIKKRRGLVLVTGPTGSGKSTTLAAMINEINNSKDCHIVTLEDPIEYVHQHKLSMVNQREIGEDTKSFANALRAVLREDPDVILVGEMRDPETIAIAITAAETGHLVFSTLHTIGASKTIDRIIDVFPPHQQQQIRTQLASVLQGIISQQLIQKVDGSGRVAALEIMTITPGIQNLIREGKSHQIESSIQTGAKYGMKTMDMALADLYKSMIISKESAFDYCVDQEILGRMIGMQ
ncbi:type IV pilus twitching motility protein PilT [Clostridium sp. HCP1S3_B4]|uniref:type IV pilus twitching motility protein PilT n=1 Tax=unclassified Clostridium TaxID=2614128 RepID=UPI002A79DD6E|nr:type IV pilus twitching motility protein PilT [Clostridiales bacterium]MDY2730329.1 type IV pilus twitching motility protein PilT [Clostridium sp.]